MLSAGLGQVIPWALKQMDGAIPAVCIFSEVGPELGIVPILQYTAGIELIILNGVAALAVAPFLVLLSQVRSTSPTSTRSSLSWSNSFSRVCCYDTCNKPAASLASRVACLSENVYPSQIAV